MKRKMRGKHEEEEEEEIELRRLEEVKGSGRQMELKRKNRQSRAMLTKGCGTKHMGVKGQGSGRLQM